MANPEHLKVLKQSVKVWNQWRKENPQITPDLGGADFSQADLFSIDFQGKPQARKIISKNPNEDQIRQIPH